MKKNCKTCKKLFETNMTNKLTCSEKCRVIYAKKRKHDYNMRPYVRKNLLKYLEREDVRERINKRRRELTKIKRDKLKLK